MPNDPIPLPPSGPPQVPTAAPEPSGGGFLDTLQALAPLIQFASIAGLQGPAAAGGFGQAFAQTALARDQLAQSAARDRVIATQNEERLRQQAVSEQRMQRSMRANLAAARERQRSEEDSRIQALIAGARKATAQVFSREEHDETLQSFLREAEEVGVNPNRIRRAVPFVSERAGRLSRTESAKKAASITQQYDPDQLSELLRQGALMDIDGDGVFTPLVDVLRASPTTAVDREGNILLSKKNTGGTTSDDIFPKSEFGLAARAYANQTGKPPSEWDQDDFDAVQQLASGPLSDTTREILTRQLRNDAEDATSSLRDMNGLVGRMRIAMDEARKGNRAAGYDLLLTTFQRINDPGSVVRENEFWRLSSGLSLKSRAEGIYERLLKGGQAIPIDELEGFARVAERVATGMKSATVDALARIRRQAKRNDLFVDEILPDPTTLDVQSAETNVLGGNPDPSVQRLEFRNGVLTKVP